MWNIAHQIPQVLIVQQELPANGIGFSKGLYILNFCALKLKEYSNIEQVKELYIENKDDVNPKTSVASYIQRYYQSPRVKLNFLFLRLTFANPELEMG